MGILETAVIPGILSQKDNMKPFTIQRRLFRHGDNRDNTRTADSGCRQKGASRRKALILYFMDNNPEKFSQYIRWSRIGMVDKIVP